MQLGRAGDRHDPRLLREQPGERDLRRGCFLLRGDVRNDDPTKARFALRASGEKRGCVRRKSPLSNVVVSSMVPVRKPLPSGANGTKPIPSSSRSRQYLRFRLPPPKRVFALQRGDGLNGMSDGGSSQRPASESPKCRTLPSADEVLHRARHIFDWHVRVDAVLIEEIDHVGPQTPERSVGHLL